ncbi:MAG TPA: hypothetical protein VEU33_18645, partial [Archangium sp.]|nr:hypothetical protein [Archangium sp.]
SATARDLSTALQVSKPEAKSAATGSSSPQQVSPFARDSFECANGKCGPDLSGGQVAAVDARANTAQTQKLGELLDKVLKGGSPEEVRGSLNKLLEALGFKPQNAGQAQGGGACGGGQGGGACGGGQGGGACGGANAAGGDLLSRLMKLLQENPELAQQLMENPELLTQLLQNPQAQQGTSASPVGELLSGISRFQGSSGLQLAA